MALKGGFKNDVAIVRQTIWEVISDLFNSFEMLHEIPHKKNLSSIR